MEKAALALKTSKIYYSITKPGIIIGNAITAMGGFLLASRGSIDFMLLLAMLAGLCSIIGSACIFNNYIDRRADAQMKRTQKRALAQNLIAPHKAILFAVILGLLGVILLARYTTFMALIAALMGFFVYVLVYSFYKYHSHYATWIGSIAGSAPIVVGYTAVSGQLDTAAVILFLMVAAWQMPHFFAIAIYRLEDYAAASIPVLPRVKGLLATKVHMLVYTIGFLGISSLLPIFGYVGYGYLLAIVPLGLAWCYLCIKGFTCDNDTLWAKKMFFFSLTVVMGMCVAIPFSHTS